MLSYLKKIVNIKLKLWLILANFLLVIVLISCANLEILPLSFSDFIFFAILILLFAIYRPGWAFLFFIGTIALENINLAPEELGIMLRPYQLIGALTFMAIFVRFFSKRLNFPLPKLKWFDAFPVLIVLGSFISAFNSPERNSSLKLSIIIFSFLVLYFLVRIFIQNFSDLKKVLPFFLSSALVISFYGIWQNTRFAKGLKAFEIMPGRPNATFTEPDWLGIYLVFCIAIIFTMTYFERKNKMFSKNIFLFGSLTIFLTTLILTVSRSAWIGAFIVYVMYIFIVWSDLKFKPKHLNIKEVIYQKFFIFGALILALIFISSFQLTTFKLFQRAQSTAGMQKITISCKESILIKEIKALPELEKYSCRHINLEEIEIEIKKGMFITETFRPDPNVNIRQDIYKKSWNEIKKNPVLGIGWGSIGKILGTDGNGNALNSSNIFLEVWLGSGIVGLLSFVGIWILILIQAIVHSRKKDFTEKTLGLFLILGIIALLIPNLFNAGILLGIVWLFLGISLI